MIVMIAGASGLLGRHLVHALACAGHRVIRAQRTGAREDPELRVDIDFTRDVTPNMWLSRLQGVDVVINAVGIVRERHDASFADVHSRAPRALFAAAAQCGVKRVIQISALGADASARAEFLRSKKSADDFLLSLSVPAVVVLPSLVFSTQGESTRLLARLAALPLVPLPNDGTQPIQPVHIDDVAEGIVRLVDASHIPSRLAMVGPTVLTMRDYFTILRRAMGYARPFFMPIPTRWLRALARRRRIRGEWLDPGLLDALERGSCADPGPFAELLGRRPRRADEFLDPQPALDLRGAVGVATFAPLLRASIALLWIVSGVLSFGVYPVERSFALLERTGLVGPVASAALYGAATLDILLGIAAWVWHRLGWVWLVQIAVIAAYTAIVTVFLPELWLHPFGPITKNAPLVAALLLLHAVGRR